MAPSAPGSRQWGFLSSALLLTPYLLALGFLSTYLHYNLPTPQQALFSADGTPIFSEKQAMVYLHDMSTWPDGTSKYRIVGTEEMVETEVYLLDAIEGIKREVMAKMGGLHEIEVWHQVGSGSHLFEFMDKMVWKKYYNITNVIVRLSDGTPEGKANAILVNAHTDSTLPSPGAADDLVGVGVMLESLRVMGLTERRLTNSVVFLFNGAEESLQDASHLFITQHPLRKSIRAVLNLEACGVAGPEIVFQATSAEMIRALGRTPRPYGTVLATEVFSTGLILSDTDFRQFVKYGNLTGIDMALVQDSYKYHTRLDIPENIEPGAIQHMGENTLALLEYLTSNETAMGNSMHAEPLPAMPTSAMIYFSGLGGHLFIVYSRAQARVIYGALASIAVIVVSNRVDWSRRGVYIAGVFGVLGSLVGALLGANLAAFITGVVMNKTLTWFRHESLSILIYGPPASLGAILAQRVIAGFVRTPNASSLLEAQESSLLEHATLVGQVVYYSILLLVGHSLGIASSYLFALLAVATLSALLFNDYALQRGGSRTIHLAAYFVGQISPLLLGIEGLVGFLDLFVPLTGRLGPDAPVDNIIASLVTFVGFLSIPMLLPFVHRYGLATTSRMALVLTFFTAGTLGWFTRPAWNTFDREHPKRILGLYMENTTTTPSVFHLYVAGLDPAPFYDLVLDATTSLVPTNSVPEFVPQDEDRSEWDIIFPIGQFLTSYKIDLPPVPSSYVSPWSSTFTLVGRNSRLNPVKRTRSIELVMEHPSIMWPVLAFSGDVVAWDLPSPPERGTMRHHVKSVAAWGVSHFTLEIEYVLSDVQFEACLRESQRAKGQREDGSKEDHQLCQLRVDFSGLDRHGMFPASERHQDGTYRPGMDFFAKMEERLPEEVDAMLVSAVAAVAYV